MLKGSIVALITPFKDDSLDEENYIKLIDYHLKNGTNGIVPGGTTGESPTLSHNEHKKIIEISVKECNSKIPVISGTGSNSTDEAVELSKFAEKAGSDALLIVTPYYNKPNQEGLYQHYKKINDSVGIPIIIYNIPSRSVIDMSVETMTKLYELRNIIGVKDATGDLKRVELQKKAMGDDFIQLTGNDDNALEFNKLGGVGAIGVTANIAAKLSSEFQKACVENKNKASEINKILQPLHTAMFIESNPSPVKYAASLLKMCRATVRLPLVEVNESSKKKISEALKEAKIL
ncbi:4-hydroxy-tetrahydrodipicolinate synthase [Pelagibacteraceae bacterium]|jgi:4-hydroxy-tetrahydrodipicolinate synthase|nr:4-hydroxy-tetrahydrodipicolinate synthase [Pelagibacteraceae bacterium]MDC0529982.1 4-hydroxy-tetrahydrodipicolinate synthase [Pelagibacteraceae bacterium]MDC0952805.1 4-hydroxy-tetrahydrodipicolinate synthase [Pelagibacteraceae bacterium]